MTQSEFLRQLDRELRGLSRTERDNALLYYREYFLDVDLAPDQDVTALVGTPQECARRILAELLERQEQQGTVKSGAKSFWLVLLGVFAAPIALPLAIVAAVLVIVAFVLLAVLVVVGIAIALVGVVMIPTLFWAGSLAQALILLGYALVLIPAGILFCLASVALWRVTIRGLARLFRGKEKT